MSYTIYTISDPQTLGAAMNGMALFFNQSSWVGDILKLGLILSLIFILAQGVLLQKGLRLDVAFLQLIVVMGAFLPKTTVTIEQFNNEAPVVVVDNVPYAIALPGALAGAFSYYMTRRIQSAINSVSGYEVSVMGANHPFAPAKILLGFATCPGDPLKCLDRNLAETMRKGVRYCGGGDLSNIRFHAVKNVLKEFANTLTLPHSTVIYTTEKPYQDNGLGGEDVSCSEARSYLLRVAAAIDTDNFGQFESVAEGIVKKSSSRRYRGQNMDISLDDAITLVSNFTDDIGRIDALALTNVMTYSVAAQLALNASSPIDQMNVVRTDNGLFRWAEEASYTAFMTSTTAPKMMDIMFFIFIAATPLVMFVVVANPQSGLKTAGSYMMFGIWSQSWIPIMSIIMAWYQFEIENFSQPGLDGTTVEYVSGLMRHVMVTTIAASKMIENSPFITFAILTGSMFALSQMVNRITGAEMPRYNPDVGGEMKGAGAGGSSGTSAHRDMALGKLANLYDAQAALTGGLGSAPISGDANAVFGSGGLSTISVGSGLSDAMSYSSQQTLAAKSGVNESVGKLLNVVEGLKESATKTQTASTGGSSQTEFGLGTVREAGVTNTDGSQTHSGTTTRAGSNNSFAFSEGLTVSKNLLGGISETAGEESRNTSLPTDQRTSAAGVEQAARAAQQAIQEAATAGGNNAALNQAAQQAADAAQQAATDHDTKFGGKYGGVLNRALAMLPDVRIQGGANAQQGNTQAVEGSFGEGHTTATTGGDSTKVSSTSGQKATQVSDYKDTDQTSQGSERTRQAIDNAQQAVSRLYEAASNESAMRSMQSQLQSSGTQQLGGAQVTNQYGDMMRVTGQASGTSGEALNALLAKMAPVFSGQGEAFAQLQNDAQNNLPQMEMYGRGSMLNNDQKAAAAVWQALSRMANSGDLSHRVLGQAGALQMAQAAGMHTAVDPMALAAQAGSLAGLRSGVEAQVGSFGAGVDYQMGSAGGSGHYGAPRGEPMSRITAARREQYGAMIDAAAQRHGLDPALLHGLVRAESNYNPEARSNAGAVGLGQLMPATAERFGVPASQRTDPQRNIEGAAKYLSFLMNKFGGDEQLALAGYNAGEGAVMKHGNQIPPYNETQAYVRKVLGFAAQERERRGQGMGGFDQSREQLQREGGGFHSTVDAGRRETADRVAAQPAEIIQRGKALVANMQELIANAVQRGEVGSDGRRLNASELQALQRGLSNMAMLPTEAGNQIFLQGGNSSSLDAVFSGLQQMGASENALNYLRDLLGSTPTQDGVPITNQATGVAPTTVGGPTASTHMDSSAGSGAPLSSTQLDHARLQNDLGVGGNLRQTAMADAGASPGSMSDVATLRQHTEASALALQGGQANLDSATTSHQAPAYSSASQSAMASDQGSGASGFLGGSAGSSTGSLQSNEQGSMQGTSPTSTLGTQGDAPNLSQGPSTQGSPSSMNATNDGSQPTAPTGSHGEAGASHGALTGSMTASIAAGGLGMTASIDEARLQQDLGSGGVLRLTATADATSGGAMSDVQTLMQRTEASALALQSGQTSAQGEALSAQGQTPSQSQATLTSTPVEPTAPQSQGPSPMVSNPPVTPPETQPSQAQAMPTTQPVTPPETQPSQAQAMPTTQPVTPQETQPSQGQAMPTTQPVTPQETQPSQGQAMPTTQPVTPSEQGQTGQGQQATGPTNAQNELAVSSNQSQATAVQMESTYPAPTPSSHTDPGTQSQSQAMSGGAVESGAASTTSTSTATPTEPLSQGSPSPVQSTEPTSGLMGSGPLQSANSSAISGSGSPVENRTVETQSHTNTVETHSQVVETGGGSSSGGGLPEVGVMSGGSSEPTMIVAAPSASTDAGFSGKPNQKGAVVVDSPSGGGGNKGKPPMPGRN